MNKHALLLVRSGPIGHSVARAVVVAREQELNFAITNQKEKKTGAMSTHVNQTVSGQHGLSVARLVGMVQSLDIEHVMEKQNQNKINAVKKHVL